MQRCHSSLPSPQVSSDAELYTVDSSCLGYLVLELVDGISRNLIPKRKGSHRLSAKCLGPQPTCDAHRLSCT